MLWTIEQNWRDPFGMLAAAFGWPPAVLDELTLVEVPQWIEQAKKWGFGGQYGRKA